MSSCVHCEQALGAADRADLHPLCQSPPSDYCAVCQELVSVNEEIERVKAILDGLLEKQDKFRSRLNIAHPSIVDRLPVEVAGHIFITYASDIQYRNTAALLKLGAICQRWRQIAWSTPELWSEISFYFRRDSIPQERLILIEEWLARAAGYPLKIALVDYNLSDSTPHLDQFFPLIHILNRYSSQWDRVYFMLPPALLVRLASPGCAPCSPSYLAISASGKVPLILPTFSQVAPKGFRSAGPLSDTINLDWTRTTDIDITSLTVDQGLQILRLSPNLLSCLFEEIYVRDVPEAHAYGHVTHPSLKTLRIGVKSKRAIGLFLDKVTLPVLQDFRLRDWASHPGPANILRSLFVRSSCELKGLKLDKVKITGDELTRLTRATPSLENLCLRPRRQAGDGQLKVFYEALQGHLPRDDTDKSTYGVPLLPSLRSFRWKARVVFPWESLSAFLVPLSTGDQNGGRRPLETIEIVCMNYLGDPETCISQSVRSELAPFQDLVKFQFKLREDSGDQFDLWRMTDESFYGSLGSYGSTSDGEP